MSEEYWFLLQSLLRQNFHLRKGGCCLDKVSKWKWCSHNSTTEPHNNTLTYHVTWASPDEQTQLKSHKLLALWVVKEIQLRTSLSHFMFLALPNKSLSKIMGFLQLVRQFHFQRNILVTTKAGVLFVQLVGFFRVRQTSVYF